MFLMQKNNHKNTQSYCPLFIFYIKIYSIPFSLFELQAWFTCSIKSLSFQISCFLISVFKAIYFPFGTPLAAILISLHSGLFELLLQKHYFYIDSFFQPMPYLEMCFKISHCGSNGERGKGYGFITESTPWCQDQVTLSNTWFLKFVKMSIDGFSKC